MILNLKRFMKVFNLECFWNFSNFLKKIKLTIKFNKYKKNLQKCAGFFLFVFYMFNMLYTCFLCYFKHKYLHSIFKEWILFYNSCKFQEIMYAMYMRVTS